MATVADIFQTLEYGPAPEAANPGLAWIEAHQPLNLYVDGEWREPSGGKYFESINPANSKPLAKIALGTSDDVDAAVKAVHNRVPHEMLLLDLYSALRPLDEITGATTTDDILNLIFSTFCIGK